MISLLRQPDAVYGVTEAGAFRFEENLTNDVKFDYSVGENSAKLTVFPSGSPIKFLKLRFRGDLTGVDRVYGDAWERAGLRSFLEWHAVKASRSMPWFCYLLESGEMSCFGAKTGANSFVSFQVDYDGITVFVNLCCGNEGVDLKTPVLACEIVESVKNGKRDYYEVAKSFAKKMCDAPVLPKQPVFGVNNWYWAYGNISDEDVIEEAKQLKKLTEGCKHKPYFVIDDGWQKSRENPASLYRGGPWVGNSRFPDIKKTVDEIHAQGALAGVWIRPLQTEDDAPVEAVLCDYYDYGKVLDPSHPFTLEKIEGEVRRLRKWGFDMIKFDFTTMDTTGRHTLTAEEDHVSELCAADRKFYDKTKTLAQILKGLYAAVQRGANGAEVIGCNTIGHLTAGINSIYRIGNDTSGKAFEWTRRDGVNSMMRLPLNGNFYLADPDCAPFTEMVDFDINADYLMMCAITGCVTIASVKPEILTDEQIKRINEVFKIADKGGLGYGIYGYEKNSYPEFFVSPDGKQIRFDWNRVYDGSRISLTWYE